MSQESKTPATPLPDSILSIVTDSVEVLSDSMLDEGLLKDIPIAGTFINLFKTYTNIRDRIFLKKLAAFFNNLDDFTEDERSSFWERHNQDDEAKRKLGDQIVIYIDRFDDADKSVLLAKAFGAYIKRLITYKDFLDLSVIINNLRIHYLKDIAYKLMYEDVSGDYLDVRWASNDLNDMTLLLLNEGLLIKIEEITMKKGNRYLDDSEKERPVVKTKYKTTKVTGLLLKYVLYDICKGILEDSKATHQQHFNERAEHHRRQEDSQLNPNGT